MCEGNLTKLYLKLYFMSISMFCKNGEKKTITFRVSNFQVKMLKMALQWLIFKISKNKKKRSKVLLRNLYMPKISILGQKLWTVGYGTYGRDGRTENLCGGVNRKVCIFCLVVCISPRLFKRII